MLIACPSCAVRYDIPQNRLAADGALMRCASCGHSWIEARTVEIIDVSPSNLPAIRGPSFEPDAEVSRLIEATREAQESFQEARRKRMRHLRGWAALAASLALPFVAAAAFSESVVAFAPAAAPLYERAGMSVNIYGLEFRKIEQQHIVDGDARVLAVKGEIWNISGKDRKVPGIRLALKNELGEDAYVWTVDSGVRPLRPGEATVFTTRVQAPPQAAETIEIRFARRDEMGSTGKP
jgi:predicted Zn finger-like uncharacterized protein